MQSFSRLYILQTLLIGVLWTFFIPAVGQNTSIPKDTAQTKKDSVNVKERKKKTNLSGPVTYNAQDSIVLNGTGNAHLYGSGSVSYEKINLTADDIQLVMDSSLVLAKGRTNNEGTITGEPVFKDGEEEYKTKSIRYNINTKKGYIIHGVVQQGDGYIIGEKTKKIDTDIICMRDGKYTTCNDHEEPHFYLNLTKAKVKEKKWVVTGPAYMVLLDVPLPLVIPFGYFPFTKEYSSGVIIPTYGKEMTRGYYLANGGYYLALSDYMDLALTGDIYTMGTWAANANSTYIKRYRHQGKFNISYREDVTGEKGLSDYYKRKNFSLIWTHKQDPKASPNSTFSSSVNFSSSGYDRSNVDNYPNVTLLSQNYKESSISWAYRFPESPFSLSLSANGKELTSDSTVSITLPDLTFNMTRIYPFKRKNPIGKDRWYEKLSVSYTGLFKNTISTKENLLFESSLVNDWKNGFSHSIPVNVSFNLLKYISISPTVNYNERWYFQKVKKSWNDQTDTIHTDTINGMYRVYDFSTGVSASTKIYGFYTPSRFLFGHKIDRIRHVITPTIGFTYKPDFSTPYWGMYSTYIDSSATKIKYSPYEKGIFSYPGQGKTGSISFSLNNNLEMKVKTESDTSDFVYKTISLIDAFSVNGSYNLAADSMNWSNFNSNLRLKFIKNFSVSISAEFDPYLYALKNDKPVHVNKLRWDEGKMPRLINTGTSCSYTFSNNTFKKNAGKLSKKDSIAQEEKDKERKSQNEGYAEVKMPWSLSIDYSVRYSNSTFNKSEMEYNRALSHNFSLRGNINLTQNWGINFGGGYDLTNKAITYTNIAISRNLHCWTMSANFTPFGLYKTYNFLIQVSSSLLSDMKYEKRSNYYTTPVNWY